MKKIVLIIFLTLYSVSIIAQTEEVTLPSDLKQLTVITEPSTLFKGFFRAGLIFNYTAADKSFNDERKKEYLSDITWASSWNVALLVEYGFSDRLTADISIPYVNKSTKYHQYYISGEFGQIQELLWDIMGRGFGDISFGARYQIIPGSQSAMSLVGSLDITLPTGRKNPENVKSALEFDYPTGFGAASINTRLLYRKINYPYSYKSYFGYTFNMPGKKINDPTDNKEREFTYGNTIRFGGSFDIHLNDWLALTNELNYSFTGKGKYEWILDRDLYTEWRFSYEARLVFQIKRIRLSEAIIIPLKGKSATADPYYSLLLQYSF